MKNILLIGLVCSMSMSYAQIYNQPIKPGMAEWKKFTTHQEMVAASQLPLSYIKQAKTEDLVQSFLNYPLLLDMYAYNNPYQGFKEMSNQFNGLAALQAREDAPEVILEAYEKVNFSIVTTDELANGKLSMVTAAFELLISTDALLQKFSKAQQKKLLKALYKKTEAKKANKLVFGELGVHTALFTATKILEQVQDAAWLTYIKNNLKARQFLENMRVEDTNTSDEIMAHIKRVLQ